MEAEESSGNRAGRRAIKRAGIAVVIVGLIAISGYWWARRYGSDWVLEARIAVEVQKGIGTVFRMADVTEFDWDRLHVLDPYAAPETINDALGFEWAGDGIEVSDGHALLVFVKRGSVARHVYKSRRNGDFTGLGAPSEGLTREDAVFIVKPRGDGASLVRFHKPSQ